MNERIEEFSIQCIRYKLIAEGARSDFDYKKFAELIVRECADIALKSGSVSNKSEVAVAEADRIYHKIQEHFGVEE